MINTYIVKKLSANFFIAALVSTSNYLLGVVWYTCIREILDLK